MKKIICFFHSVDHDGHCSAEIVRRRFSEAEFIGINYGDHFPLSVVAGRDVVMVDFSLKSDLMPKFFSVVRKVIWIEHHKTAIQEMEGSEYRYGPGINNCEGVVKVGLAACELAWDYFFPGQPMPYFVKLLGRYDVWDHQDLNIWPFHYGLEARPTNLQLDGERAKMTWDALWDDYERGLRQGGDHGDTLKEILLEGRAIERYNKVQNASLAQESSFETELLGVPVVAVNHSGGGLELLESVYVPGRHKMVVIFGWKRGCWHFSLRVGPDNAIDVSTIATQFPGGGGHAGSAGFQVAELPIGFLR